MRLGARVHLVSSSFFCQGSLLPVYMKLEKYGMARCIVCESLHPSEQSCCTPLQVSSYVGKAEVLERFTKLRKGVEYNDHGK